MTYGDSGMKNRRHFFEEMTKAILSYRARTLSLNALVTRLEELVGALTEVETEWGVDIDDTLLQMEIMNSLLLSGDKSSLSPEDVKDLDVYLQSIELEIASHMDGEA